MDYKKHFALMLALVCLITPALASQTLDSTDIKDGSTWNIGNGYYMMVEGVDYKGEQAFVSIWNDGEMLKEDLIQAGHKFEYFDSTSTSIISMKLTSVFRGMTGSVCHFTDIRLRYGEPSSYTPTPTPTATKTAVPTDTPSPRSTRDVNFGDGALIPGFTAPMVGAVLILTVLTLKKQRKV